MVSKLKKIILIVGCLGILLTLFYSGPIWGPRELYFVVSLFLVLTWLYFTVKAKLNADSAPSSPDRIEQIEALRKSGEKISITLENCEVKSRTYHEQVDIGTSFGEEQLLDTLYDGNNRHYKNKEIRQTYLVYYKKYGEQTFKFISQAVADDPVHVRMYLSSNKATLFIDKQNPNNYYFEVPWA